MFQEKEFAKVTYSTTNAKIASVKNSKIMLNGEGVATVTVKVAATKHYQAQNIAIKINVLKRQNITNCCKEWGKNSVFHYNEISWCQSSFRRWETYL